MTSVSELRGDGCTLGERAKRHCVVHLKWVIFGNSLVFQLLGLHLSISGGMSSIPGQGTKILHAAEPGQKKRSGVILRHMNFGQSVNHVGLKSYQMLPREPSCLKSKRLAEAFLGGEGGRHCAQAGHCTLGSGPDPAVASSAPRTRGMD